METRLSGFGQFRSLGLSFRERKGSDAKGQHLATGHRTETDEIKLQWATFQVMRRTHASLSRKAGVDPKLVADQLGHGLGVNLDVYTVAGLDQRLAALNTLEESLISLAVN